MQAISPKNVRYIKLCEGGDWEESCINENTIRLGYESPHHQTCLDGNWDAVRKFWLDRRAGKESPASNDIRQIRDFYELKETDIWITIHRKKLYWCHASHVVEVHPSGDGTRIRHVIGSWSSTDINGKPLLIDNIDGRVTKVEAYRGTICSIDLQDYLIKKINGLSIPEAENAKASLERLRSDVQDLIKGLSWQDFELLIDLIFSKAGWQRFSVMGKTGKDIDIDVYSPTTQKRGFVQIKSSTNRAEIESYIHIYRGYEQFKEMYFVFHTCNTDLTGIEEQNPDVYLWGLDKISGLVVNSGLVEWLINKRA